MTEINSYGCFSFVAQESSGGVNSRVFYLRNLYPIPAASSCRPSRSALGAVRPLSTFQLPHAVPACVFLRSWLRQNVGMEAVTIKTVCCLLQPFYLKAQVLGGWQDGKAVL